MKPSPVKSAFVCAAVLALASAASATGSFACGSYSTAGAGNAFVGTWSCPSLPAGAQVITISENLDDSLSIAGGVIDAGAQVSDDAGTSSPINGSPLCQSDEWTFSGSTATMQSGVSCLGGATGAEVITMNSFSLKVSGSTLTVTGAETVKSGGEAPDGAPTPSATTQNVTLSSTCTKQ